MTGNTDVAFSCDQCNKTYSIKASFQSHMRLKHKSNKASEEAENGGGKSERKKSAPGYALWVENEKDMPMMNTRDLNSFLDNRSDSSLAAAAMESEQVLQVEEMVVEKLMVKDHELDWFQEDNECPFDQEFTSDYASSLRRESIPSESNKKLVELHNNTVKKMTEKYDALVVNTTRMLNIAEITKKDLRKTVKSLNEQLAETQENWQGDSEAQAEEISFLKSSVTALKLKVEELELISVDNAVVKQKCTKCNTMNKDSETLAKHMKEAHGVKEQRVKCQRCPEIFTDKSKFKKHLKDHKNDLEFYCDVCKTVFGQLEEAKAHTQKPCGNIKQRNGSSDTEVPKRSSKDSEEVTVIKDTAPNKCNACNKSYKTNQNLENHIATMHSEKQCNYCDLVCGNEQELVEHHHICSEIGVPNMTCKRCSKVFTKQGIKRHQTICQDPQKDMDCYECGELFSRLTDLKKHKEDAHKMEQARSRTICRHWKKGSCTKGELCGFSHTGQQNKTLSSTTEKNHTNLKACRNGQSCEWLKKDKCNFFHAQTRGQGGRQESRAQGGRQKSWAQGGRQESQSQGRGQESQAQAGRQQSRAQGGRQNIVQPDRDQCQFDGRCERIPNCPYIHSLEDFPLLTGRKQPVRRTSNNLRQK